MRAFASETATWLERRAHGVAERTAPPRPEDQRAERTIVHEQRHDQDRRHGWRHELAGENDLP
jgi:hypothetical protein